MHPISFKQFEAALEQDRFFALESGDFSPQGLAVLSQVLQQFYMDSINALSALVSFSATTYQIDALVVLLHIFKHAPALVDAYLQYMEQNPESISIDFARLYEQASAISIPERNRVSRQLDAAIFDLKRFHYLTGESLELLVQCTAFFGKYILQMLQNRLKPGFVPNRLDRILLYHICDFSLAYVVQIYEEIHGEDQPDPSGFQA